MVKSYSFPPGTPVWYNMQYVDEFTGQKVLRAYEGIVRSVSNSTVNRKIVCEVLHRNRNGGDTEVIVEMVDQDRMAYGSGCLVHVKMPCTFSSSDCKEMNGEIVCPNFPNNQNGDRAITYTVKLFMSDGSISLENGIPSDRVRYRFGLDRLREKMKGDNSSKKMVGIRTSSLGLPVRKRRIDSTCTHQVVKMKILRNNALFSDQGSNGSSHSPDETTHSTGQTSHTEVSTKSTRCKHQEGCSRKRQKGYEGYCFAHYFFLMQEKKQKTKNAGSSEKRDQNNTEHPSRQTTETVDLTEG